MSRRAPSAFALSVIAGISLALLGCGGQAVSEEQNSAASAAEPDAEEPVVVQIGDAEFATTKAIYRRYEEAKGGELALREPLGPAGELDGGRMQEYASGTIYWSPGNGAHIVRGQILTTYLDNGGPTGSLGWPVTDEISEGELTYSEFENGRIRLEGRAIQVIEYPG
ncbi:MAG TPA: hypothetical protein H9755_04510 [Candidatus Dietzia intestinigallinarum]|nr:hypothetical protein [Candidatus Dietzia intestinigallinarum]